MSIDVLMGAGADRGAMTGLAAAVLAPKSMLSAEAFLTDVVTIVKDTSAEELPNLHAIGLQAAELLAKVNWSKIPDRMRRYRPRSDKPGVESSPFYNQCISYSPLWHLPELAQSVCRDSPNAKRLVICVLDDLIAYVEDHSTPDRYQDWIGGKADRPPLLQYHSAAALAAASLHELVREGFSADLHRLMERCDETSLLSASLHNDYQPEFIEALSPLRLLLSYRHEERHPRNQPGRRKKEGEPPPQVPRTRQEDDGVRVTSYSAPPDRTIPDDVIDEVTEEAAYTALIIEDSPGEDSKPAWKYFQEARYRRKHLAKSHLFAPLTLRAISDPEICRLEALILGRKLNRVDAKALAAMLLLGMNLNEAKAIVTSKSTVPARETPQLLTDTAEWRIPVKGPHLSRSPRADALPVETHLSLPIPHRWRALLLDGLDCVSDAEMPLLPEELTEGKIRSRLKKRGLRLRLSRVSAWLSRALFLQTFQHNAAALLTNRSAPHNVTLRHYEHPTAQAVRDDYLRVLAHLEELTGAHLPDLHPPLYGRIGTPTASPPHLLRTWVCTAVQQLKTMPVDSLEDRYAYCNCTLATVASSWPPACCCAAPLTPTMRWSTPNRGL